MGTANNHIRDQGGPGLLQTLSNLHKRGLKTAGSGKNLAAARKPAIIETHGVKVAILAYDAIQSSYHATGSKIGSAPMNAKTVTADVKAARKAGRRRRHRVPALGHRVPRRRRPRRSARSPTRSSTPAPT